MSDMGYYDAHDALNALPAALQLSIHASSCTGGTGVQLSLDSHPGRLGPPRSIYGVDELPPIPPFSPIHTARPPSLFLLCSKQALGGHGKSTAAVCRA